MTKKWIARFAFAVTLSACTILGTGCGAGTEDASASNPGNETGMSEQELTRSLGCGQISEFPTWSFWGLTTVTAWNQNPERGAIKLRWQSGLSGENEIIVTGRSDWSGRWAAFPIRITYLSWVDPSGVERGCEETGVTPGGAPVLLIKTNT